MKKNKLTILLVICLILTANLLGSISFKVSAAEKKNFIGTRLVEYSVDKSDIDNFIDGGKAAFDLILRANTPQWVEYQISSKGRDMRLCLQFDFESYEDYSTKLSELLTYSPSMVCSTDNQLLLLESHSAIELLNYFQGILFSRGCINEKRFDEMFEIEKNEISINSADYQSQERISIRPENDSIIKFDSLDIRTTSNEDGSFARKITVNINNTNKEVEDMLLSRFNEIGTIETNDSSEEKLIVSVDFVANNQSELIKKTMTCLGTATSILEKQAFLDEQTVNVERIEFFDLESLMNEEGQFNYSHTYPSYTSNIIGNDDNVYVSGSTVSVRNTPEIICQYQRPIKFSSIEIYTDLSNFFGKLKRTITFTVPTDIAADYHSVIKNEFQNRLIKGSVFNIYDEGGKRYYEITFSSFFSNELSEFNNAIVNSKRNIKYSNSWIPFGNSYIKERIEFDEIFADTIPPDEFTVLYKLPTISSVSLDNIKSNGAEKVDSTIEYSVKSSDNINLEYRCLNILKLIIELLPIIAITILVMVYGKKKKRKNNGGKE